MKYFKVKVNGNVYDVEVEEVGAAPSMPAAQAAAVPQAAPVPQSAAAPQPAPAPRPAGAGNRVESPMAGKIVNITVKEGDRVELNQPVAILEAMKMENEIVTPYAGTVSGVSVTKGQNINAGELIMIIS